jgi:hypothetical protein
LQRQLANVGEFSSLVKGKASEEVKCFAGTLQPNKGLFPLLGCRSDCVQLSLQRNVLSLKSTYTWRDINLDTFVFHCHWKRDKLSRPRSIVVPLFFYKVDWLTLLYVVYFLVTASRQLKRNFARRESGPASLIRLKDLRRIQNPSLFWCRFVCKK